ncbi:MAG: heliorhodopsin HeR [Candidatus Methanomethylophilaceae archaeon]
MASEPQYQALRKWNLGLGALHFVQALVMLIISLGINANLPIQTSFLSYTGTGFTPVTEVVVNIPIGAAVSAFLFLSALAHFTMASPWVYPWYAKKLSEKINYIRWFEYSLSSSWMLVIIAMLCGIYDLGTLVLIFGSCAVMNLCGLLMEMRNQGREKVDWTPFWVGCVAGLLPWIAIILYFLGALLNSTGDVPTFLYFIIISLFVSFNVFPIIMVLQYTKKGKFQDYLYGERGYMIMSLVAKTLLAWQVWSGTLRPLM